MTCGSNTTALTLKQQTILAYIYLCTSCASFMGATSIVIAACVSRKIRSSEVLPLFHLSVADMLASISVMVCCCIFLIAKDMVWDNSSLPVVCSVTVGFVNSFYFATFILTLAYSIEVYRRLQRRLEGALDMDDILPLGHRLLYIGAWLIPLVLGIGGVILGDVVLFDHNDFKNSSNKSVLGDLCLPIFHDVNDSCIGDTGHQQIQTVLAGKYVFLIPLMLIIIALAVVYIMVIKTFRMATISRGILGPQQRHEEVSIRRRASFYIVVFCVCWIPSIILGIITLTKDFNSADYYPLYVIQSATATMQGFFNSIVYGWSRAGFQQQVISKAPRQSLEGLYDDQTLLPESSQSAEF